MNKAVLAVYSILLFVVSVINPPEVPIDEALNLDKAAHFIAYGILGWLACRAVARRDALTLIVIIGCCTAYGIFIELYQSMLPTRSMSTWDAIANGLGSAAAVSLWRYKPISGNSDKG